MGAEMVFEFKDAETVASSLWIPQHRRRQVHHEKRKIESKQKIPSPRGEGIFARDSAHVLGGHNRVVTAERVGGVLVRFPVVVPFRAIDQIAELKFLARFQFEDE